jgi:hypothetical protein
MIGTDVIETEPKDLEFTGLLTARGVPIVRKYVPKPPIGFAKDAHQGFDYDPDEDFILCTPNGGPVCKEDEDEDASIAE